MNHGTIELAYKKHMIEMERKARIEAGTVTVWDRIVILIRQLHKPN